MKLEEETRILGIRIRLRRKHRESLLATPLNLINGWVPRIMFEIIYWTLFGFGPYVNFSYMYKKIASFIIIIFLINLKVDLTLSL